jgi:hypothetical protein
MPVQNFMLDTSAIIFLNFCIMRRSLVELFKSNLVSSKNLVFGTNDARDKLKRNALEKGGKSKYHSHLRIGLYCAKGGANQKWNTLTGKSRCSKTIEVMMLECSKFL